MVNIGELNGKEVWCLEELNPESSPVPNPKKKCTCGKKADYERIERICYRCGKIIDRSNHSFRYTIKKCGDIYRGKLLLCKKCEIRRGEL